MSKIIQGSWFFKPTILAPSATINEIVSFTCGYKGCNCANHNLMSVQTISINNNLILTYENTEIFEHPIQKAYDRSNLDEFLDYGLRKITFSGEQTVSDEFYAWFTSNATACVAISGPWLFKSSPSTPRVSIRENVSFTCGYSNYAYPNQNYMSVTVNPDGYAIITYENTDDNEAPAVIAYNPNIYSGFRDIGLRMIVFKGTQYVTPDFYNWFVSNADEYVAISGAWTFNQNLPELVGPSVSAMAATVDFKSNYKSFTSFTFDGGSLSYEGSSGTVSVYDSEWVNESYRTIDFGTGFVYVPPTVRDWLTTNAKFTGTIAGVWTLNDTLTGPIPDQDEYEIFPVSFKVGSRIFEGISHQDPPAVDGKLFFDDIPVYNFATSKWIVDDVYRTINFGFFATQKKYSFWEWLVSNATRHESVSGMWRINDTLNGTGIDGVEISAYVGHIYDEATVDTTVVYFHADRYTATVSDVVETFHDRRINFGKDPQSVSPEFYAWFFENATNGTPIKGNWRFNETLLVPTSGSIEQKFKFYGYAFGRGMFGKAASMKIESVSYISDVSFTINGVTYAAEEGMTWAEWLASEYNVDGYHIDDSGTISPAEIEDRVVDYAGNVILSDALIRPDGAYKIEEEVLEGEESRTKLAIKFTCFGYVATGDTFADEALYNRVIGFGPTEQIVSFEFYDWMLENAELYAAVNGTWILNDNFEPPAESFSVDLYLYGKYRFGDEWVQDPGVNRKTIISGTQSSIQLNLPTVGFSWLYYAGQPNLSCLTDNKLDFGEDLQEVSSAFYDWLYANATFVEKAIEDIYQIKGSTLRLIADSIRDRAGLVGELNPVDMPELIRSIAGSSDYQYAEEVSV